MKTFTRDLGFVNFNGEEMQWIKFNNVTVYEAWRKLIASGVPPITLQKCKGVDLIDYKVYGNSVQGENLINYNDFVNLSGNSTYYEIDSNGNLVQKKQDYRSSTADIPVILTLQPGSYTYSASAKNRFYYLDDKTGSSASFVIDKETTFKFKSWDSVGTIINPILKKVPTPETPIEVESVGDKSPNLINWDLLLSSANNNPIEKVENGYYGTRYSNAYYRDEPLVKHIKSILKPNVTYTLSRIYNGTRDSANGTIFIQDSASTNIIHCRYGEGLVKTTFTLTQEQIDSIDHLYIYFHNNGGTISELQLTEGNSVLTYEPYGYRIPIKVRGKNLFNLNKLTGGELVKYNGVQCYTYKDTNNNVGSGNFSYEDEFKENTRYTFTTKIYFEDTSKNTSLEFLYTDGTKSTVAISKPGTIYKFTTTSGKTLKQIRGAYMWGIMRYIDLTVTQLEEGTTATAYEPYYEPITTNIYLNEPLRKLGDKSDYIDFESGKVIRWVKELKLTNVNYKYTWLGKNGVSSTNVLDGIYDRPKGLCNRETRFTANGGEKTSIWLGVNTTALYWIGILDYLGFTTLEEMNEWLANNPTYIYYGSNKTSEETIELPNIPTHKGTTIIEVDTNILPSNMKVKYYGKE